MSQPQRKKLFQTGFTLVELLVVMGIIGVLAAMLFSNFAGARDRARDAKRKGDLTQIKSALRLYYNDFQSYPADDDDGNIDGCGDEGTTECTWKATFSAGTGPTVYMNQLPQDPLYDAADTSSPSYAYAQGSIADGTDTDAFRLTATLENLSDPSISDSQKKCGVADVDLEDDVYMVCSD